MAAIHVEMLTSEDLSRAVCVCVCVCVREKIETAFMFGYTVPESEPFH